MPTLLGRNYQLKELEVLWAPIYESVLDILGSTGSMLPIADPHHGQPVATTFKSVGEEQDTWTWSEAPGSFDSALDLTTPGSFKGIIPIVNFNSSTLDEEADTPDSAYHSRVTGAFSIGLWIRPSDVTSVTLFGKLILTGSSEDAEYVMQIDGSSKLDLTLYDNSEATTNWTMNRPSSTSIVADQWQFVVVTCNATQTAATDINLYINGAVDNGTGAKGASFTAMEAGAAKPSLAFHIGASALVQFYGGPMAGGPLGKFFTQTELSADAILRLFEIGRRPLAL